MPVLILKFLPRIYELGRSPSAGVMVQHILDDAAKAITSELTEEIQVEHKSHKASHSSKHCSVCPNCPVVMCWTGAGSGHAAVRTVRLPSGRPEDKRE